MKSLIRSTLIKTLMTEPPKSTSIQSMTGLWMYQSNRSLCYSSFNCQKVSRTNFFHEKNKCCLICKQIFTPFYPLSVSSKQKHLCVGCARLLRPYRHNPEAKLNINTVIGALSFNQSHHFDLLFQRFHEINELFFKDGQCYHHAKKIINLMTKRCRTRVNLDLKADELVEIMKLANGKCAVTGIIGVWKTDGDPALWPLLMTIDHRIPVSRGGSWKIQNLQVMPLCINQVKGNNDDKELSRWFTPYSYNSGTQIDWESLSYRVKTLSI